MAEIKVLSEETIDKIAAGEVVERPMSVVKELVENAMDAGAKVIAVEIKNGGIDLIRVSDNGQGIEADQIRLAFARHATSKIRSADDLTALMSMGFRGEALSSIAAVSQVELITKTKDNLTGVRFCIEGAVEKDYEEIGAPDGTTFLVKNLFFNTPVRRKFLKQPQTEGGYVAELLERLALSRPDISFKFIQNGQVKFHTPGNNDLKEVIYRIYGREIAAHLIPVEVYQDGFSIKGFLGKPEINRSNRNYEHYFINSRYVKSKILSKAIEDGYKQFLMQHKFPFVVLHFQMPTEDVDVNVHPTKMEVRFSDEQRVYKTVSQSIADTFKSKELIVNTTFGKEENSNIPKEKQIYPKPELPENFIVNKVTESVIRSQEEFVIDIVPQTLHNTGAVELKPFVIDFEAPPGVLKEDTIAESYSSKQPDIPALSKPQPQIQPAEPIFTNIQIADEKQETLFTEEFLSEKARESYEILGQMFGTYWVIAYSDRMYIIDQHAAHEKVKYERLISALNKKEITTQNIMPPVILQTSAMEEQIILEHLEAFEKLGFEIEEFGDHTFCLRAVPIDLYGCSYQELFRELLDELADGRLTGTPDVVLNKLASMACKAAVKGNMKISREEAEKLIDELLTLENPYHCPHGRPTIISMTKQEIEKKFKRIV